MSRQILTIAVTALVAFSAGASIMRWHMRVPRLEELPPAASLIEIVPASTKPDPHPVIKLPDAAAERVKDEALASCQRTLAACQKHRPIHRFAPKRRVRPHALTDHPPRHLDHLQELPSP